MTSKNSTPDLAFISQHLFTAILWVNEALSVTWLNAQAEQLLAISRGRLLNQSILALLAPEELHPKDTPTASAEQTDRRHCSLATRFEQAKQYQQPFIDHDHIIDTPLNGHLSLSIDYSVTPLVYEQQTYFIIEIWGKDRQSRISEEQRQQQQYGVARHMLRSVAHEIKNPLAGIRGAAQLLQRQFITFSDKTMLNRNPSIAKHTDPDNHNALQKTSEKLRGYTDIIISETDRLTHLVNQFLGSNQLPNRQNLNIHEPLEHVLSLVSTQYPKIALQRDYDLSLPELYADKNQLIQVFLNLINNACESMSELEQTLQSNTPTLHEMPCAETQTTRHGQAEYKPVLQIQTRIAFQHTIMGHQHKQVLQVNITDNGSGIDPALIGQIFFPMVTSRAAGTGLGLSIVQDIVSHHHGMIEVSCTQTPAKRQTRFTLYLPFHHHPSTKK